MIVRDLFLGRLEGGLGKRIWCLGCQSFIAVKRRDLFRRGWLTDPSFGIVKGAGTSNDCGKSFLL